ncbi:MAG: CRTAC1 family protein [Myxococcales bacterium]|nr:CRTAC1 family protein [Myxococcales bacterium]
MSPETGPFDPRACGSWDFAAAVSLSPSPPAPMPCDEGGLCPTFTDVTEESGLTHAQWVETSPAAQQCMFPLVLGDTLLPQLDCEGQWATGGAAVADFDLDGWPDILMTRLGAPDLLYRNLAGAGFEEVAARVGLGECTQTNGASWADLDNDGDPDLVLSSFGGPRHRVYINDGGCFHEDADARGLALPVSGLHAGMGVTVGDYDRDGWLDVHVNEWIHALLTTPGEPYGARLLRNTGGGVFVDVTAAAGVELAAPPGHPRPGVWAFSSALVDLDDDRLPDLAVAADFETSRLLWNNGDGTFRDGTVDARVATEGNAMGSSFGDQDGDGRLDWFVSAIANADPEGCALAQCPWRGTGNRLYRNLGAREFADATDAANVRDGAWGWGASFFDYDNDGDLDLAQATGWPGQDLYGQDALQRTRLRLWRNDGGVMTEVAWHRGLSHEGQARALVTLDYDRDGDLDVLVANHAGPPALYRNDGGDQRPWIALRLEGRRSNRDARGAVVTLQATPSAAPQVRQVGVESQFLGHGELALHFGLGDATSVYQLRVRWPNSDSVQVLEDLSVNQTISIVEPE